MDQPRFYATLHSNKWNRARELLANSDDVNLVVEEVREDSKLKYQFVLNRINNEFVCETIQFYYGNVARDFTSMRPDFITTDSDCTKAHFRYFLY